ncbi:putative nucleosome assembly protein (NAP) [Rosa chinensis]|uniref:Putative nucleosome assembly protein (NAP) n=1 Tax=Rosa chinensis TaxID=74649 RepID=A0A2P6SB04_ROSCH|nr:nucleosome assembly protein 1;2 [Rosa chinensis]PRQ55855.1 putative nucleosome assembly protein (NAP) [Rosa chinensis]
MTTEDGGVSKKRKAVSFDVPEPDPDSSPPSRHRPSKDSRRLLPVPTDDHLFDNEIDYTTDRKYRIPDWIWHDNARGKKDDNHRLLSLNRRVREIDLKRLQVKFLKEEKIFQDKKQKWVEEYLNQPGCDQDELKKNLFAEVSKWEARYEEEHFEPFYKKRYEIVTGGGYEKPIKDKGLDRFWVSALMANQIVVRQIESPDHDYQALCRLTDIRCHRIKDPRGFKLEFLFSPDNPFFKNEILTKTFEMIGDNSSVVLKGIGTEIEWYDRKSLTEKLLLVRLHKGSQVKVIEKCRSFFNFFETKIYEQGFIFNEESGELKGLLPMDYIIGLAIRNQIIPHAALWYKHEEENCVPDDETIIPWAEGWYEYVIDDCRPEDHAVILTCT